MDDIEEALRTWAQVWRGYSRAEAAAGRPIVDPNDPQAIADFREWLTRRIDGETSE